MGMSRRLWLTQMDSKECWHQLGSTTLGRLGISVGALPSILPVVFCVVAGSIVFRVGPDSKLLASCIGNVVAFEADEFTTGDGEGWSVLAQGIAWEVTASNDLAQAWDLPLAAVAAEPRSDRFIAISPSTITGRSAHFAPTGLSALLEPGRGGRR
jgi:uncharacterized protein